MNIAFDIDGTITKAPMFFSVLSRSVRAMGGRILIVTSRANSTEAERQTRRELGSLGIEFDALFIISDDKQQQIPCPHESLNWYQKYLWQKVKLCLDYSVAVVFEDDSKVIALFEEYAPGIQVFHAK